MEPRNEGNLAVTDNGITITPETIIVDKYFAHISFSVKGYDLAEGDEPGFDDWDIGVKDDKTDSNMQAYGGFYDGIVSDENGSPVYEDGSSLQEDEQGRTITHYVDKDGNLEYVVSVGVSNEEDSLLGKTIYCKLKDLGTLYKTSFTLAKEDTNQVPLFKGVVLKDGKKLPFLGDAGGSRYDDDAMTKAYSMRSFVQVIDPDQVQALIMQISDVGGDTIEVPIQ